MVKFGFSLHVAVKEHLVIIVAEHGGFHTGILKHAFNPQF